MVNSEDKPILSKQVVAPSHEEVRSAMSGTAVSEETASHPIRQGQMTTTAGRSLVRQGVSSSELLALHALTRLFLESGQMMSAEKIAKGLVIVAPEFLPAWLSLSYVAMMRGNTDSIISSARQALRADSSSVEALLFLVIGLFEADDYQSGGTYLGEVADRIRAEDTEPRLKKIYEAQVLRFEQRLKRPRN